MPFTIEGQSPDQLNDSLAQLKQKLIDNEWESDFELLDTLARYNTTKLAITTVADENDMQWYKGEGPWNDSAPIYSGDLIVDWSTGANLALPTDSGGPFEISDKATLDWALKKYSQYSAHAAAIADDTDAYTKELLAGIESLPEVKARRTLIDKARDRSEKIIRGDVGHLNFFKTLIENAREIAKANIASGKSYKTIYGSIDFRSNSGKVAVNEFSWEDAEKFAETIEGGIVKEVSIKTVKPKVMELFKELRTIEFELREHFEEMNDDEVSIKRTRAEEISELIKGFDIEPPSESMTIKA